jgi:hypothetical protein
MIIRQIMIIYLIYYGMRDFITLRHCFEYMYNSTILLRKLR